MDSGQLRRFRTSLALAVWGCAICCALGFPLSSADDSRDSPGATPNALLRPCVLLKNGNVIDGVARQVGHQVLIDGIGGRIALRYEDVACWADSLRELYQYRLDHREGDSNTARLADAKWCLRNGLDDEARQALAGVHPRFQQTRQWKQLSQQAMQSHESLDPTHAKSDSLNPSAVRTVGFDQPVDSSAEKRLPSDVDISAEQLALFTRDIQPMLLNRCAGCHHLGVESKLRLTRPTGGRRASSSLTQMNLRAISPYLSQALDSSSSLHRLATEPHGTLTTSPLSQRDQIAADNLHRWLGSILDDAGKVGPDVQGPDSLALDELDRDVLESATHELPVDQPRAVMVDPDAPARLPQIEDPFDPDRFNRRYRR